MLDLLYFDILIMIMSKIIHDCTLQGTVCENGDHAFNLHEVVYGGLYKKYRSLTLLEVSIVSNYLAVFVHNYKTMPRLSID